MSVKIGFFASGGGSNFKAIHQKVLSGEFSAQIVCLISNNGKCGAMEYARSQDIPAIHISGKTHPIDSERDQAILDACRDLDLIILAGYMKHLPLGLVHQFKDRILNIHPSLLPSFGGAGCYGIHVHEKALARGVKWTGITVHLVTEEYDEGPILFQDVVPVLPLDTPETLQHRVLQVEHKSYWKAIQDYWQTLPIHKI